MTAVATWKTHDGTVMAIRDMTDDHLVNAIRMLRRNAAGRLSQALKAAWAFYMTLQGDVAQYTMEREIDHMEELTPTEFLEEHTPYRTLMNHARQRGLRTRAALDTESKPSATL
jgi:hypothetical protein